jgi:RimJ/RimL family protein N-acetyltransferase
LDDIHELHSLPQTDEFNTLGIPESKDETQKIIEPWIADIVNYTFAIKQSSDDKFVGLIALKLGKKKYKKAEVWFKLNYRHWNKGYGKEALSKILDLGFNELQLHRIEAGCAVGNIASIKLLEKVGMTKEGRKRKVLPLKNGWSDNFEYAILATDFKSKTTYNL